MKKTTESVDTVLEDPSTLASVLQINQLYQRPVDAHDCYGPTLDYSDHPDSEGATADGELPSGDLGIWRETMPDTDEDGIAEACAAAQMNSRMTSIEGRVTMSLAVLAAVSAEFAASGGADISAYLPEGVTLEDSSFSADEENSTYIYGVTLSSDGDSDGTTEVVDVTLTHYQNAEDENDNEGLLTVRVKDNFMGGNCGVGDNAITLYTSIHYVQNSGDDLRVQARDTAFCGSDDVALAGHAAFGEPVASVNTSVTGNVVDPDASWSDNFSIFTAEFDPTPDTSGEMAGRFSYAWQAGNMDSNSRILDVGLSIGVGGESYFGFGDKVQDVADVNAFGMIRGFICNWAGPGNSHDLMDYAQRQHLTLNTDTGFYVPTNSAASDITYAPTNSCAYDGTGTFLYDRNLSGALDEVVTDVAVGDGYADLETGLDFDLLGLDEGNTDIWDKITNVRNYQLPAYPAD